MLQCPDMLRSMILDDRGFDPCFNEEALAKLRNDKIYQIFPRTYFIYDYNLVKQILKNSSIFTSSQIGFNNYRKLIEILKVASIELEGDVLFSDFDQHSTLRSILVQNYTKIYQYIPMLVRRVVLAHFEVLDEASKICIAHDIATTISEKIFLELSGIGKIEQYSQFKMFFRSVRMVLNAIDNNLTDCNQEELIESWNSTFLTTVQKLSNPDQTYPNLLYGLATNSQITQEQKAIMVLAFIRAGIENPRSFIVSAIIRYFQYPELYEANNIRFLDEVMRYDCPAKITARHISSDFRLGKLVLKGGHKVWLSFRLANFSERVFINPFDFQLRKLNPNLSLGVGPHFCIGKDLTYKLTIAIIEYIKINHYSFSSNASYLLDDSLVFRRYADPIYIFK